MISVFLYYPGLALAVFEKSSLPYKLALPIICEVAVILSSYKFFCCKAVYILCERVKADVGDYFDLLLPPVAKALLTNIGIILYRCGKFKLREENEVLFLANVNAVVVNSNFISLDDEE